MGDHASNLQISDDLITAVGVFGTEAAPYLLYTYRFFGGSTDVRTVSLTGTATTRTLLTTPIFHNAVADDSSVFILANNADGSETQLHRLPHGGTLTTLATRIFIDSWFGDSRMRLSPTRVIVVSAARMMKIMGTDLGNVVDMPRTMILADLMAADQPLVRRDTTNVRLAAVVLTVSAGDSFFDLSNSALSRYGAGRVSTALGRVRGSGAGTVRLTEYP